jgi:hypothetical protein
MKHWKCVGDRRQISIQPQRGEPALSSWYDSRVMFPLRRNGPQRVPVWGYLFNVARILRRLGERKPQMILERNSNLLAGDTRLKDARESFRLAGLTFLEGLFGCLMVYRSLFAGFSQPALAVLPDLLNLLNIGLCFVCRRTTESAAGRIRDRHS